jgi:hypothetical protein
VAEVEDFVEFLAQRDDRQLPRAAARLAEKAFRKVWGNPADAAYDRRGTQRVIYDAERSRSRPVHSTHTSRSRCRRSLW